MKFILIEDQEVHEEEDLMDKHLKVAILFGQNNYNKSIKEAASPSKKPKNQTITIKGGNDDEEDFQNEIHADGTIDT